MEGNGFLADTDFFSEICRWDAYSSLQNNSVQKYLKCGVQEATVCFFTVII